ncbi:alpha/beta hydrolase [Solibacillus sp. R5-41]|uniref:alpha/beta fold hydrolase n=1 Tax=Solibacillus sp. R5-41 TaxID=2048654 RepID=UPI000C125339|nr:alpha/beta hydrolase [Solibacillus sp. R5-41]ATP39515.1 alpha/beta hydrolase [Solibacillus sp. R5-41]
MNYTDRFINTDINMHYIETNDYVYNLLSLVYIPGALGNAEQFIEETKSFFPRHCISMSLRGRGKSDAPLKGYTFEEHILDISSVIKKSNLSAYCLMAYSMGVPYAIRYATSNPSEVKGLILCDYPAKYPRIPEQWVESAQKFVQENRQHVVKEIQKDSKEIILWEELKEIKCPVLVIKGGTEKALLKKDAAEKYKSNLKHVELIEFTNSGHELWVPDYNKFIISIKDFLNKIDT